MPEVKYIAHLQQRLAELGCPAFQVRRLVREVADHREDLKQTALTEGYTESEAETHVDTQLGDPVELAECLTTVLRRSSWWGRHSFAGFCVLPLVAIPVLWSLVMLIGLWLEFALGFGLHLDNVSRAADNPAQFHYLSMALHGADYAAISAVSLLFCWLTYRAAVNFKWTVTACAVCSLYAVFSWISIRPHSLTLGCSWHPQWIRFAIPLLMLAGFYVFRRQTALRFHESVSA